MKYRSYCVGVSAGELILQKCNKSRGQNANENCWREPSAFGQNHPPKKHANDVQQVSGQREAASVTNAAFSSNGPSKEAVFQAARKGAGQQTVTCCTFKPSSSACHHIVAHERVGAGCIRERAERAYIFGVQKVTVGGGKRQCTAAYRNRSATSGNRAVGGTKRDGAEMRCSAGTGQRASESGKWTSCIGHNLFLHSQCGAKWRVLWTSLSAPSKKCE